MNYKETIEYLYKQLPVFQHIGAEAYKPGLDNSLKLSNLFDDPWKAYKTIHVGGTNGKGSVSHTLAAILQEAGYKVGLFTSPHLIDFRERIRVNGEMVDEEYVVDFVEKNKENFEPIGCSFFELTMMLGFCYFRDQNVDIAIVEVGLGGRLDSTNIIEPVLSVITNIGFDHTQFLGNTLKDIASEKAGIIKKGIPVIVSEVNDETKDVFLNKAKLEDSPIILANERPLIVDSRVENNKWIYSSSDLKNIEGGLGGLSQLKNANAILYAIDVLRGQKYNISDRAVLSGFKNVVSLTGLMGRWQILQSNPLVITDTAHNREGIEYVVEQLRTTAYNKLHLIVGFAKDKDVDHILEILPQNAKYYFVNAQIDRALLSAELMKKAKKYNLEGTSYRSIEEAYNVAISLASEDDVIFVGGSNFVVGELLSFIL